VQSVAYWGGGASLPFHDPRERGRQVRGCEKRRYVTGKPLRAVRKKDPLTSATQEEPYLRPGKKRGKAPILSQKNGGVRPSIDVGGVPLYIFQEGKGDVVIVHRVHERG